MAKVRRRRQKSKKPTAEHIASACSILNEIMKREATVNVLITFGHLLLHFDSTIKMGQVPGWYDLPVQEASLFVAPAMCDEILFHPDGGLLLIRKDVGVMINLEERDLGELLEAYPAVAKFVH